MSRVAAREALITLVVGVDVGMPVYHENREAPDLDKLSGPFLEVAVDFNESSEADLKSITENLGVLVLTLSTRVGEGVVTELSTADALDVTLSRQRLNGVTLGVMTPGRAAVKAGWRRTEWLIPFSYYS